MVCFVSAASSLKPAFVYQTRALLLVGMLVAKATWIFTGVRTAKIFEMFWTSKHFGIFLSGWPCWSKLRQLPLAYFYPWSVSRNLSRDCDRSCLLADPQLVGVLYLPLKLPRLYLVGRSPGVLCCRYFLLNYFFRNCFSPNSTAAVTSRILWMGQTFNTMMHRFD